jgi:hypothetical protein
VTQTIDVLSNVRVTVTDAVTGELLAQQDQHNLVVNDGLDLIRDLLDGDAVAGITHFAAGTGTAATAAGDAALGTEVFRDVVGSRTSNAQQLVVGYYLGSGSANSNTLGEAALLNAASSGTMFARVKLSPTIVKTASIAVTFTWTINLGAS